MSTIYEIAKLANVSPATVSQVLSGRRQMKWPSKVQKAARIREIAERLGYKPNSGARALRSKKTSQVGLLLVNSPKRPLHNPASFEFMMGINQRLEAEGYVLAVVRISEIQHEDQSQSRVFRESMLDGMIVVNQVTDDIDATIRDNVEHVVYLDGHWHERNCVRRDEIAAGRLAASHALEAGYRHLVWAMPAWRPDLPLHYSTIDRREGVRQAAHAAGVEVTDCVLPGWSEPVSDDLIESLSAPGAAIIGYDSFTLSRICYQLMRRGVRVGESVGLVACDGTLETTMAIPALSYVAFDRFQMGQAAANLMLAAISGSDTTSQLHGGLWHAGETLGQFNPE